MEPWEELKTLTDMEYYDWERNVSKTSVEAMFGCKAEDVPNINIYSEGITNYMNEGKKNVRIIQLIGFSD